MQTFPLTRFLIAFASLVIILAGVKLAGEIVIPFLLSLFIAIICSPFSDADLVFLKFKKLHANLKILGINRLQAISVANSGETSIEGIKCEVAPFSRWALGI